MKIKHKLAFISIVSIIDIMVIVLVVMSNGKTNIKNDISTKTAAHIIEKEPIVENIEKNIVEEQEINVPEENNENVEEIVNEPEEIVDNSNIIEQTDNIVQQQEETITTEENNKSYDDMTLEEKQDALNNGTLALEYSGLYNNTNDHLTKSGGVYYYNGHKETYYDEKVLPGPGLNIPGRHVAEDGTIRDEDGYICVASDLSFLPKGAVLITSLGPAKVYDTGCSYGTIDIYVNW